MLSLYFWVKKDEFLDNMLVMYLMKGKKLLNPGD